MTLALFVLMCILGFAALAVAVRYAAKRYDARNGRASRRSIVPNSTAYIDDEDEIVDGIVGSLTDDEHQSDDDYKIPVRYLIEQDESGTPRVRTVG